MNPHSNNKKAKREFSFMAVVVVSLFYGSVLSTGLTSCGTQKAPPPEEAGIAAPEILQPTPPPNPYPNIRGQEFRGEKNFARLINEHTQGKVEPTPWAGFWWPYTGNGIAAGSFRGNESPAGKYDAARGRITNAQGWEVTHHGAKVPQVQQWWGHCNGWCVASALFPEPKEDVTVNGINFGVGDIKALLTEAGMSALADFYGERVDIDDINSPKYWDTIPDQYFLVLTNYIGKLKQAVLIDRYTGSQVWNQPLAGYRFEYPKPSDYLGNTPSKPNVYRIIVNSTIWWMDDGVAPDVITEPFTLENADEIPHTASRQLSMEVWLDGPVVFEGGKIKSSGDVIVTREGDNLVGGAWRMGEGYEVDAWPDYMWIPYAVVPPSNPDQDYTNPEVDINWIRTHLLVAGGADDPTSTPSPIEPAPMPSRTGPTTLPTSFPTAFPSDPFPRNEPTPRRNPFPIPGPGEGPSVPEVPMPQPPWARGGSGR